MGSQYQLWIDIQDQIGDASLWPYKIRALFWTPVVKHWERILLVRFAYVNGLNPVTFMEWADMVHWCRDRAAANHFRALFRLFEGGRNYTLYAYNIAMGQYQYLDGRVHYYVHASLRK